MMSKTNLNRMNSKPRNNGLAAFSMIMLMLMSVLNSVPWAELSNDDAGESNLEYGVVGERNAIQTYDQEGGGNIGDSPSMWGNELHPSLLDPQYSDPAVMYGKISDLSLVDLRQQNIGPNLEETNTEDHDNDGINDLDDLDDDNDGIYDLIERFDGCFATDPYDHDNDGLLDHDDWDDDNDGILEGPIDWNQGSDPVNVSSDRYVNATTIHPATGQPVGFGYRIDQNLWDHDNDGVPDEDMDGSGRESYDEDDDNDGRIDQFSWPCDDDADGARDYFDDDDDNDGVLDWIDANPYDASVTGTMQSTGNFDAAHQWTHNDYRAYSGGLNFVSLEALFHPASPVFTTIWDGDLDGDGIPNFLDADGDNDGSPNNVDADDDNDGILDMYDPDDDNDGIRDVCWDLDTNGDGLNDYNRNDTSPYQTPGHDTDGISGIDCELDYDWDSDNDRWRAIDFNYNHVWDWFDVEMGGTTSPDNPLFEPGWNAANLSWDLDDDGLENEVDPYPMNHTNVVNTWNCEWNSNYDANVDGDGDGTPGGSNILCTTERASYTGNNDWDGDGILNYEDVDDDNDGIPDFMDIDTDCDLDNDNDIHQLNGSKYRDDGPNDVDTDIDGDGLQNDEDWDDDNDGIADLFDPDDGNCGIIDQDTSDSFYQSWYPLGDGDDLDGTGDSQRYTDNVTDHWNLTYLLNPFSVGQNFILNYNGFDGTTSPPTSGVIPEFWWIFMSRWSSWNGDNKWDIDGDGDTLQNGLDIDQDADGMPDWWDQDEGNDGILDVDDPKMGGSLDFGQCGFVVQPQAVSGGASTGLVCGFEYALQYGYPLSGFSAQMGIPYSTRPDATFSEGSYDGANSQNQWRCTSQCYHFSFGPQVFASSNYTALDHNRDLFTAWIGLKWQLFNWNQDTNGNFFPDEFADHLDDEVDPDDDCGAPINMNGTWIDPTCMFNDTADLDDDFDSVYDLWDVDDDGDGIWDYFEIDTNNDLDDDAGTIPPGNFFTGLNCQDKDDDGQDSDPDGDGWYQAVWDKGVMGQGYLSPEFYDVDNDNDGVPDGEDWDDDNNGVADTVQELVPGCFDGEEQYIWDHDNDGIPDWGDDDWDGDGRSNAVELATATPLVSPWDHDNDGERDDEDEDDDEDGMKDKDEILLWPTRFNRESTNPWDHDDYGNGEGIYNIMNNTTGPDGQDVDDDNDTYFDVNHDVLEENSTSFPCYNGSESSDWDHDNDCFADKDDKIPTRVNVSIEDTLWMDANSPALFGGWVEWLNLSSQQFEPAENLPVQVSIVWTDNGTLALETVDVLTNSWGQFTVGQFLYPEDIHVGDNTTYTVTAEVTEMFVHDGSTSIPKTVGVKANLTVDFVAWYYFRSDEQPLWLDFKAHYSADWDRGFYDQRIEHAPITFEVSGGPFGNRSSATNFTGFGMGYRTDSNGWCSLTFIQANGNSGIWEQVVWNSTLDNGPGMIPGGYEMVLWNDVSKQHEIQGIYNYSTTSLPVGDYDFLGYVNPTLASEWPFPYLIGDHTDPFTMKSMHRMYVEAEIIVSGDNPVYFWDATVFTGSSFGAWRALYLSSGLAAAGTDFQAASIGKPWPMEWDGDKASLLDEAARLRPFLNHNSTHWYIAMQNGADFDVPPCGPIDANDPESGVRCEIIPEMDTGENFAVLGNVSNRTFAPWAEDPMALQVDLDHNGIFQGSQETGYARKPTLMGNEAVFNYNWSWYSQYEAATYGIKVDFTNSNYYFTGNQTAVLAPTGAYVNISVVGTTDFELNSVPRLYRNTNSSVEARLVDNAMRPVKNVAVNWSWSATGEMNSSETDANGIFKIPMNISSEHQLGNFTMSFEFPGNPLLKGSSVSQDFWVVSQTFINLVSAECAGANICESGDVWEFTAQVTDDNRTPGIRDLGSSLSGDGENGGNVSVIFEGYDFENIAHRQVVSTIVPNAGVIHYEVSLDPQALRQDPASFLPEGFGPVNVILRFNENLPNEGCEMALQEYHLTLPGQWDPCTNQPGNDHFRRVLRSDVDGFAMIGRTVLDVDQQIVYTSETDPNTGEIIEKPMVVTGRLLDELGSNLTNRQVRIYYEMQGSSQGPVTCNPGSTDLGGYFEITCPLQGVMAGQARVTIDYNSWENNDRQRYKNSSVTHLFPVFSNSSLEITEVGPYQTDVDRYTFSNGTSYPVLYLKESFHIEAFLKQSNGQAIGGKCINIYLNPDQNTRPIATAYTGDEDGAINWFSGDPEQNPSRKGVEPMGNELEGFRLLRLAYEPDRDVSKGCDKESSAVVNGSTMDILVLVRSKVDMQFDAPWERINGYLPGDEITGSVAVLRNRIEAAVAGQQVHFIFQYWNGSDWVNESLVIETTSDRGIANFTKEYTGTQCGDEDCDGLWRIIATFPESAHFVGGDNLVGEVDLGDPNLNAAGAAWWTQPEYILPIILAMLFAMIIGAVMYKRYAERRRISILQGILTDTMMQLQVANEYVAVIFNCYKDLVRFFRQHGFMKKVYETTREFEWAVREALRGIASPAELDAFISIFEEARYSDHQITVTHRDRALQTLQAITTSISLALGEQQLSRTSDHEANMHTNLVKAGEFIDSEGNVKQAGLDDNAELENFSL